MTFFEILYTTLIKPLQLFFEYIFSVAQKGTGHPGLSIIALSLAMNILVLPLYKRADEVQDAERDMENKLRAGVSHIRKTFKGDEKMMMLQTYYRQNGYKPTDVFKGSVSLFLEIPFFIAAYQFLSHLSLLNSYAFGPISDLGAPDALIKIGALSINLLPIIMTSVNLVSCIIFTKGYPLKTKIQLYGMAIFFFFFLYKSPAGLVFYWTLNNIFSLVKTIYYKSEKARKVLMILFSITGASLIVALPFFLKKTGSKSFLLTIVLLAFICFIPLIVNITSKRKIKIGFDFSGLFKFTESRLMFIFGGIYMAVFTGLLIPSQVIKSSPQEFVDIYHYSNPLWFVVSSICIATGLFVLWFIVFYSLAGETIKKLFNVVMWIICVVATVDYMFFGENLEILNSSLNYTHDFEFPIKTVIINLAVVLILAAAVFALVRFLGKKLTVILVAGVVATFGMSVFNCVKINNEMVALKEIVENINKEKPQFNLSKKGQNVIVFMLDRAAGEYIPYFVNEKPELKEMFDGFTYYPNTVSFGVCTNIAAPALFGGYEYTPEELNKRDTELLQVKNDEALKVMPVLFNENGYDVTVCDPPWAGYSYIPDLGIYSDYPDINAYITKGYFWNAQKSSSVSQRNYRNFFCYALMKSSPIALQKHLYNYGMYNESVSNADKREEIVEAWEQVRPNGLSATGISDELMQDYTTLCNLSEMTNIVDDDSNTFMMIDNEMPHCANLFQEPDYEVRNFIDNYEYEKNHQDRYTVNGITLKMSRDIQLTHYQTNMASLLTVGRWLDYLKEEGVYDNTRIIIVGDHARWFKHNDMYLLDDGTDDLKDIECYYPLLMIKDFNSKGFMVDEQFMTNADVPTYALEGLIENPINPFTGKEINNDEKYAHPQKIYASHIPDATINNGTTFIPGMWLSVEKDMRDKNNWQILSDDRGEETIAVTW